MERDDFHELAKEFLESLIPGSVLEDETVAADGQEKLVTQPDSQTIHFRARQEDRHCFVLKRKQPFKDPAKPTISESRVVGAFVGVVGKMTHGLTSWYEADLRATFPRRVVAKALCNGKEEEETILTAIDQLSAWAGQQYEGKPIPAAFGFVNSEMKGPISFRSFTGLPMAPVISNGFDTILICSLKGKVLGHQTLGPLTEKLPSFAPFRLALIAKWASEDRIGLVLNRTGEILIFRNGQLRFTRRGGLWHFLTHNPVIRQMARPENGDVRSALYSTCLDASFARTGACIGVLIPGRENECRNVANCADDYLNPAVSKKAKILKAMIGENTFQNLSRQLRQELLAIDGATLLSSDGTILAVGAILKIEGGSRDGGRRAAAIALSKLGLGIKVSQDGQITGFHDGDPEPKFTVM